MLRVAIDEGPLHGPRTGIGNAVSWLLEALRTTPGDLDLVPYVTSLRARPRPPTRRLPLPAAAAHRLWARTSRFRMDRWLGHPDVVHGTNYVVPPTGCPRIVSVYDTWFLDHPDDAVPDVARAGTVLRRSVAEGAHVIVSSQATGDRVRALFDTERISVIHLGPPIPSPVDSAVRPGALISLGDDPFVLALGTVERRKNLPFLVRAFARLAPEHTTAHLVIAGGHGDGAPAVASAIAELDGPIARRIHWLGRVGDDEKSWLLEHAAVLAYPSLDEGFGFPMLEAQQVGTPVVASSAGSIPEVAGTGALLSGPTDVDALAANLLWALTDATQRTRLIARGHENVARFSWRATADAHLDLYEEAVRS